LFISHRMEEVFAIADRVTVLRDGRFVSSHPAAEVTPESAIRDMVGRHMEDFFSKSPTERGDLLLSVRDLSKDNVFHDINFDVHAGEVVGFAGLVGSRRTDVALALFGIATADSGTITLDGQTVNIGSPQQAVKQGLAYVTEDRRQLGLTMPMSITTNISLPMLPRYLNRFGLVKRAEEQKTAEQYRDRLAIRAASMEQTAGTLSGGNQQKVVLSKWLNTQPRLLILDEPTRGIDVGAKAEVHQIIDELAQQGMGIILISSDLPEVLAMSDRIVVMREGRQMAILDRSEATQERVMTAAMGQTA
jgi:rhamnose transport system ATP-binding protein